MFIPVSNQIVLHKQGVPGVLLTSYKCMLGVLSRAHNVSTSRESQVFFTAASTALSSNHASTLVCFCFFRLMQKEIEQGNDSFSPRILYALRAERIVITTSLLSCSELYVRPLLLFLFAPGSEGIAFEVFFIYVDGEQGGTVKRELGRKGIHHPLFWFCSNSFFFSISSKK